MLRRALLVAGGLVVIGLLSGCFLLNLEPVARFSVSFLSGESPLLVTFDASESYDSDGEITEYRWTFGDGSTAGGITAEHVFAPTEPTNYTVRLEVEDDRGAVASREQTIEVRMAADPGNNPPSARFTFQPTYGDSPLTVEFDATLSSDVDGDVEVYAWLFGDGATGSGERISYTYHALADTNYAVTLTAYDDDGASGSTTAIVSVYVDEIVPDDGPTAEFTASVPERVYASPNLPEVPSLFEVTFDPAGSTPAPGYVIEQYVWTFGDGESAVLDSDVAVTHVYRAGTPARVFAVGLTVIDDQGLSDSVVRNVTVIND